ncbi:speckle-type POZ protein-like [Nasonia vitripennis]|uniref:Uncharacterized protein n=1 Tax=Nasonia vitripennis TaxID=7425 RepID=A0A7M7G682_NASVI|nr:speckle-type POZ protein-like [Nasonia vitripennis]
MSDTDDDSFPELSQSSSTDSIDSHVRRGVMKNIQSVDIWKIHKYSRYQDACTSIESPRFSSHKARLVLYPKGISEEETVYVGLSLVSLSNNTKIQYRFAIIDKNEKAVNIVQGEHYFHKAWNSECTISHFISKTNLMVGQKENLLVDDILTIACELNCSNDYNLDCQNYVHTSALANDLRTLYDNQDFSDIKLVARGKVFHAHKNILASRSSVFAAMFRHKMKENVENIVPIKDVGTKVLKEMLHYMYTGSVRDMKMSTAQDLLIVAEKYDILGLKKICGTILEKKLTVNNAIDILILADSHNAMDLKKNTVDFLTKNIKAVMGTKSFKTALNSHLTLVINTIEKIINVRVK